MTKKRPRIVKTRTPASHPWLVFRPQRDRPTVYAQPPDRFDTWQHALASVVRGRTGWRDTPKLPIDSSTGHE